MTWWRWAIAIVGGLGGPFLIGILGEWWKGRRSIRREYKLFRAMQQGDEQAGEEWYEMVRGRHGR